MAADRWTFASSAVDECYAHRMRRSVDAVF